MIRLGVVSFIAYLWFSACALSQSATDMISDDVRASYTDLKDIIDGLLPDELFASTNGESEEYVTIGPCVAGANLFPSPGRLRPAMIGTAFAVIAAERILVRRQFPEELWRSILDNEEEQAIRILASGDFVEPDSKFDEWEFVNRINEATRDRPDLPRVAPVECGGGPLEIEFRINPPSTRLLLLPKHYYLLCQKRGLNPLDRDACDLWLPPIRNGETVAVGGTYKYVLVDAEGAASTVDETDLDRYKRGAVVSFGAPS